MISFPSPARTAWVSLLFALVLGSALAGDAAARVWRIRADGSGDRPTLDLALAESADRDSVLLGPGGYEGPFVLIDKSLTLVGEDGAAATILHNGGVAARILTVIRSGSPVVIKGLTFLQGYAAGSEAPGSVGGGVGGIVSPLVIRDCVFESCWALGTGGAVYCRVDFLPGIGAPRIPPPVPSLRIHGTSFNACFSGDEGGAVFSDECDALLDACVFTACTSVQGGAVGVLHRRLEIAGSRFEGNVADLFAGALYASGMEDVFLHDTTFRENQAMWRGAGMEVRNSGPTRLLSCAFINNRILENGSDAVGAGLSLYASDLTATEVLWYGGAGGSRAAGVHLDQVQIATFERCTWLANTTPEGSSLVTTAGTLTLQDCILGDEDPRAVQCVPAKTSAACILGGLTTGACFPFQGRAEIRGCPEDPAALCETYTLPGCGPVGHARRLCPPGACATDTHPATWGGLKSRYR